MEAVRPLRLATPSQLGTSWYRVGGGMRALAGTSSDSSGGALLVLPLLPEATVAFSRKWEMGAPPWEELAPQTMLNCREEPVELSLAGALHLMGTTAAGVCNQADKGPLAPSPATFLAERENWYQVLPFREVMLPVRPPLIRNARAHSMAVELLVGA